MPRGDRTGPEGKGPATGRGMGPCVTEKALEKKRTGPGRGMGLGRGRGGPGRGMGRRRGAGGITYFT